MFFIFHFSFFIFHFFDSPAHPLSLRNAGNLCVDKSGNLVYYDYGMMDELKPTVREGFRNLCFSLFEGGPFIDDIALAKQAKQFKLALEQMGVLAKGPTSSRSRSSETASASRPSRTCRRAARPPTLRCVQVMGNLCRCMSLPLCVSAVRIDLPIFNTFPNISNRSIHP